MQGNGFIWYDNHMETAKSGNLLVTACDTIAWRYNPKLEFKVEKGQVLLLLGTRYLPKSLNNMMVVDAVHPRYGRVECLACDLRLLENT